MAASGGRSQPAQGSRSFASGWRDIGRTVLRGAPALALVLQMAGSSALANIVSQGNVLPETGLEQLAGGAISMPAAAAAQAMGATISGEAWGGNLASASNQTLIMERID